jgi:hypothetical protein
MQHSYIAWLTAGYNIIVQVSEVYVNSWKYVDTAQKQA